MRRLGAHMSIAGGLPRAVDRARLHGCTALQIFTRSCGQWRSRVLPDAEVLAFRQRLDEAGIGSAVSHASYLINLAAPPGPLRAQSIEALGDEIDRAERLGLLGVVLHPGAATGQPEADALANIADGLRAVLRARRTGRTMILLEHTAGQGSTLGWRFEHLRTVLEHLDGAPRVGVCLDTCHLHAAGYPLDPQAGYLRTMRSFDRLVGLDRLRVLHLNDSRKPAGSRVDRHAHIGEGTLGLEAFRRILCDRRLRKLPMLLETPKAIARGTTVVLDDYDVRNLATLRSLCPGAEVVAGAAGPEVRRGQG